MVITYFVDDKLGGVTSLNYNLVMNKIDANAEQQVIHIDLEESIMTRSSRAFPVEKNLWIRFSRKDNYYQTLRRLSKLVDLDAAGALILNYDTEMAMLDHYPTKQTTYQLVHDDFNVTLARKFGHLVDVFICHNSDIYRKLLALFPERKDRIFNQPHGVPVPAFNRTAHHGDTINLVFLGRMTEGKGIFDLLVINDLLRKNGVQFAWTCIGNGPQLETLKQRWNPLDKVQFAAPSSNEEVLALCAQADVFVLPTKFEGSPVSLLETMSVGLVPVITRLEGGITDIVTEDVGFAIDMDNNKSFAAAIEKLYRDRELLARLGGNCRKKIETAFDVRQTATGYHRLFGRYREFYRDKKIRKTKVGARLDQPFIPSPVTRAIRNLMGSHAG